MAQLSTRSTLQKRLSTFVDWIAPKKETRKEIKSQSDEIREKMKGKLMKEKINIEKKD